MQIHFFPILLAKHFFQWCFSFYKYLFFRKGLMAFKGKTKKMPMYYQSEMLRKTSQWMVWRPYKTARLFTVNTVYMLFLYFFLMIQWLKVCLSVWLKMPTNRLCSHRHHWEDTIVSEFSRRFAEVKNPTFVPVSIVLYIICKRCFFSFLLLQIALMLYLRY